MISTQLPGPKPLPIVGHLPSLMHDPLRSLTRLARDYGDVVQFRVGLRPLVLVSHPQLIDRVVRDRAFERSPETRRGLASFIGDGLLSLEGPPHMRHRRLMQPAFHRERIRTYVEMMSEETYATLAGWQGGQALDFREAMMRLTFAIVSRTLFHADTRREAGLVDDALREILPAVVWRAQAARALPWQLPFVYGRRTQLAIQGLQRLVRAMVAERRRLGGDRGDLLSMLLAARDEDGSQLSDEDVAAECLTILLAGHETTANTLSWAGYLLTQHPDVQQALRREVHRAVGQRPVGFEDLPKLPLAERVINEALRLYPPAWWGDRYALQDTKLGDFAIPARTTVAYSIYVMQRDPRFFPEPERFDPDRFSPERAHTIPAGAHLPFGAGVHMCIGNTFALMEARLILAALMQHFQLSRESGRPVRPLPLVTLGMAEPLHLELTAHGAPPERAQRVPLVH